MTAHEIAGHTRECARHGQYISDGSRCPVCVGLDHGPRPNTHHKPRYADAVEAGRIDEFGEVEDW